jgi:hypothetical protein
MILNKLQITPLFDQSSSRLYDKISDPTCDEVCDIVYYAVYEQVYDNGLVKMWNPLLMYLIA